MLNNKQTIETYMQGLSERDPVMILSCLINDVIWDLPGCFYYEGKNAFDK
ncbi:MAG: hypothetical protein M3R25_01885 [Bacteroidota bacterium]|nr:hypothetical protein [Bacteroidota bacterium]